MTHASGHPVTVAEALEVVVREARALPPADGPSVCRYCFGPRDQQYQQCAGCQKLKSQGATPDILLRTVPVSIARSPGPWWNRFSTYKTTTRDNMYYLAIALGQMVLSFGPEIERALGGPPTMVSVVPSKRNKPPNEQLLWQLLALVASALPPLMPTALFHEGETLGRGEYAPQKFFADREQLQGARVLLIEDAWISGATAVSTMGRLLEAGAEVLLLPICRRIEPGAIAARPTIDQAYLEAADQPWMANALQWPRP